MFTSNTVDEFVVYKYTKATSSETTTVGSLVDTIYASGTIGGTLYKWRAQDSNPLYIDIGIKIMLESDTTFSSNQVYQITPASIEEMAKKKIWHGGYATWLRLPPEEDTRFYTDDIPMTLINRNLTFSINQGEYRAPTSGGSAIGCFSTEDTTTNTRISIGLEWNIKNVKDRTDTNKAMHTDDDFIPDQDSQAGTQFASDLSSRDSVDLGEMVFHSPSDDVTGSGDTGTTQEYNYSLSGRAGYARLMFQHQRDDVAHNDAELARNQFLPIVLIIS